MKLSISNIAWLPHENGEIQELLGRLKVSGIEAAPTLLFGDWSAATPDRARIIRSEWNSMGFEFVALQSLFYNHPEWNLFGPESDRKKMKDHLKRVIEIGGWLGAATLVFGSPKNRKVGALSPAQARTIAVDFFGSLSGFAFQHGTCLAIEPNPPDYQCDFVTTTAEAITLVEAVGLQGFGLHVDSGAMALNGETIDSTMEMAYPHMRHFHISEPFLQKTTQAKTNHEALGKWLRKKDYRGWVSIEMNKSPDSSNLAAVEECVEYSKNIYLEG